MHDNVTGHANDKYVGEYPLNDFAKQGDTHSPRGTDKYRPRERR